MKKLQQSAGAKMQNSRQRMQRRNYQVGGTKKRSVHPPATESAAGANAPRRPGERRKRYATGPKGPYKLDRNLIRRFVGSIDRSADLPIEAHCGICGIGRVSYYEWRKRAEKEPGSIYAEFVERVDRAMHKSWERLHALAVRSKPFEILARRHPDLYPNEARLQLTGKDDEALFPAASFNVLIELNPESAALEKEFVIEQMGGQLDGKQAPWLPGNGDQPS